MQLCPGRQALPQAPQCWVLVTTLVHAPPQTSSVVGSQVHCPARHRAPGVPPQARPSLMAVVGTQVSPVGPQAR